MNSRTYPSRTEITPLPMVDRSHTTPASTPRWIVWIGFAACAWGTWFAALHVSLFFGGGSFTIKPQFAGSRWVYFLASGLSMLLFTAAALLPLALVWPFHRMARQQVQNLTLSLAFAGMGGFSLYELLVAGEPGVALFAAAICLLGAVVGILHPRYVSPAHWMVLIATWCVGAGMTLYGASYIYFGSLQPTPELRFGYLLLGGLNFGVQGVLFVATALLTSRHEWRSSLQRVRNEPSA